MNHNLQAVYGLKWNPFSPELPTEALWSNPEVEHFCWRLQHQVRQGGFALITGEPGVGKSVALRLVAQQLSQLPEVVVGVLIRPQSHIGDFYRELGDLFGVPLSPHNRWCGFKALRQKWFEHLSASLYRPILLIDEAQEMHPPVLSELRVLSSADFDSRCLLTLVLCGDQRLTQQFRSQELLPIASRIRVRLNLEHKTPAELLDFLKHALNAAGNPQLMTEQLMLTLSEHALGNYRVLCTMADELLAEALRRDAPQLDQKLFFDVFPPPSSSRRRKSSNGSSSRP